MLDLTAHITVKPYERLIKRKLNDKNLKLISNNLILSNSGEAIITTKNNTKGILLRGYKNEDFSKLEISKNEKFTRE